MVAGDFLGLSYGPNAVHLVKPFPFERLQQLTTREMLLLDRVSGWLAGRRRWSCEGLGPALGASLEISAREILPLRARPRCEEASQIISLEHAGTRELALLEVDAPIALELVWLSLAGAVDASLAAPRPLDRVEQGVLLYLVSRAIGSLWGQECPFRVAGIGTGEEIDAVGDERPVIVHLTLRCGATWGHAWLHLSPRLGDVIPIRSTVFEPGLDRVGGLQTCLHVMLGRVELSADQWREVHLEDVVLLDEIWTSLSTEGELEGTVRLRLPNGRPRWAATMTVGGALSIDGLVEPAFGVTMDQEQDQSPTNPEALLAEIPAEMTVELGRIALTARDALSLRPGQTLRLARRPGDPVELRIGPTRVARGELVVVEGEIGVLLREVFADASELTEH